MADVERIADRRPGPEVMAIEADPVEASADRDITIGAELHRETMVLASMLREWRVYRLKDDRAPRTSQLQERIVARYVNAAMELGALYNRAHQPIVRMCNVCGVKPAGKGRRKCHTCRRRKSTSTTNGETAPTRMATAA
jgi:hypothetical protein